MTSELPRAASAMSETRATTAILTVVVPYAAFAALWILLSDKALVWLVPDPAQMALASTMKGWVFVAVTSLLLYRLMRRLLRRGERAQWRPGDRSLVVPLALLALAIIGLTAAGIAASSIGQQAKQAAELRAIADLKVQQIEDWVSERYADARFAQSSQAWVQLYRRWRDTGDTIARDQLLTRLGQFQKIKLFRAMILLDERGVPLWHSDGESLDIDPALRAAALEAAAKNEVRYVGPFRDANG